MNMGWTNKTLCITYSCGKLTLLSLLILLLNIAITVSQSSPPGDPSITSSSQASVAENTLVTLTCQSVTGNPAPSVIWYRGNTIVDDTYTQTSIAGTSIAVNTYTSNIDFDDMNVVYTCKVKNIAETKNATWVFTEVTIIPSSPVLEEPSVLTAGVSAQFNCTVARYYPAYLINWKLGGVSIFQGSNSIAYRNKNDETYSRVSILTYVPVLADNQKFLRCEFTTSGGVTYYDQKKIAVFEPSVSSPRPSVDVKTTRYTKSSGSVTLQCTVTGATSITWYKDNNVLNTLGSRYSGGTVSDPSLTINNVISSDSGNYICSGTASGRSTNSTTMEFIFGDLPSISTSQTTYSATLGSTTSLQCSISATPAITDVTWEKNVDGIWTDVTIDGVNYGGSSTQSPSLIIYDVNRSDEGFYICSARNILGTSKSGQIFMDVVGSVPTFSVSQTAYTVTAGSSQTLQCSVSGTPPVTNVFWQRILSGVRSTVNVDNVNYGGANVSSPSLTVFNADSGDEGYYICRATNSIGTGESEQIYLSVVGNKPTVTVNQAYYSSTTGSIVTLQCSYSGNPQVTSISWQKIVNGVTSAINVDGSKYGGSTIFSPSLVIYNVDSGDNANYRCLATNSAGTGQSSPISLSVTGAVPRLTVSQTSYSVTTGQTVTLQCSYTGIPSVTSVFWRKYQNRVTSAINIDGNKYGGSSLSSPSLIMYNADSNDSGTYVCYAVNSVGTGESSFISLSVSGSKPTVTVAQTSYSVTTGSSVTLQCSYSGNPQVTNVVWEKVVNGVYTTLFLTVNMAGSTLSNPSLQFLSVSASDAGTYRCTAVNSVGTGQSDLVSLSVTGNVPRLTVSQTSYSVTTGQTATLQCSYTGIPSVTSVFWRKYQNRVTSAINIDGNKYGGSSLSSPSLIIYNADSNDSGTYVCYAVNSVGTGESSLISLSITGSKPTVTVAQTSYSVTTGSSVTLQCSYSGNPQVTNVVWEKVVNGAYTTLFLTVNMAGSTLSNPSLQFLSVSASDAGTYRCTAVNSVGTGQSDLVSLSVTGNTPTVSVGQASYSVTTGQTATLQCSYSGSPAVTSVYWKKTNNGVTSNINVDGNNYGGSTPSSPSLIIYNVDTSDSGSYVCYAVNSVGTGQGGSVSLSVTGSKPTVTVAQTSYSVTTGSSVTLQCSYSGNPQVTNVVWEKLVNGAYTTLFLTVNMAGSTLSNPSLQFLSVSASDAGTYRCTAVNSVGTGQSDLVSLSVTGNTPTVSVGQDSYSVTTGQTATLQCSYSGSPAVTSVYWKKTKNGVTSNINVDGNNYGGSTPSSPSLIIYNVDTSDSGSYWCYAVNSVGTGQGGSVSLSVTGSIPTVSIAQSSYSVTSGQTATLQCSYSGNPAVTTVSWQKNVNGVTSAVAVDGSNYGGSSVNSPSLIVYNADLNDSGSYTCYVTNSVGTGQGSPITLNVIGDVPTVTVDPNSYSATVGSSVTLQCSYSATPQVTNVVWQKIVNGVYSTLFLTSNMGGATVATPSLVFLSVGSSDAGTYRCTATNSVGTGQSALVSLSVTGNLPTVTATQTEYSVTTGSTITLQCSYSGSPQITNVFWQKITNGVASTLFIDGVNYGGSTVSSPSLLIYNVNEGDAGTYKCMATNSVGTAEGSEISLTVTGSAPDVSVAQATYSVSTGTTVTLVCTVTASPAATSVSWVKTSGGLSTPLSTDGVNYGGATVSSPSLIIYSADSSDSATYVCKASNSIGTGESTQVTLVVTGNLPSVSIPLTSYSVTLGNSITIPCSASGNPTPTKISWTRTSGQTTSDINVDQINYSGVSVNSPSLVIVSAKTTDQGYYTCRATNAVGTADSSSAYLYVTGNIPTVTINQASYSVLTGSSVTLTCVVAAEPQATSVAWQRIINGVAVSVTTDTSKYRGGTVNTPSLTIIDAQSSDQGDYYCLATNVAGTGLSGQTYLSVTGNIPVVSIGQNSYSVTTGSSVTLGCTFTASPQATDVDWLKISGGVTSTVVINNSKFSGSSLTTPSLTISDSQEADEGYYQCQVTNAVGPGQSILSYLSVSGNKPTVNIGQSTYSVTTGMDVTLTCTASAIPAVNNVSWKRSTSSGGSTTTLNIDGSKFGGATVNNPSLTIYNTDNTDIGYYTCSATNSLGTGNSAETFLLVSGSKPVVSVLQTSYSATTGQSVTLQCSVSGNPAVSGVTWKRTINGQTSEVTIDGSKFKGSSVNAPSLTISSVDTNDQGTYKCMATNLVGTTDGSDISLTVSGSVPTVTATQNSYSVITGQSVTLQCNVSAVPAPTSVTWQRTINGVTSGVNIDGSSYTGSSVGSPSLTIGSASRSDAGSYVCRASNVVGTGSSVAVALTVSGSVPTVTIATSSYSVTTGNTVTLDCTVNAIPGASSVTWEKSVNSLTTNITVGGAKYGGGTVNSPSLVINNADNNDRAFYTCTARNIVGTGRSQQTYLSVSGSLPTVSIGQAAYTVTRGNSVTLQCSVIATPGLTAVVWERTSNGATTKVNTDGSNYIGSSVSSPSLTISSAGSEDAGTYVCKATNLVGMGESTPAILTVTGDIPTVTITKSAYNVTTGVSITLPCTISATPPHTSVYWQRVINQVTTTVQIGGVRYIGGSVSTPSLTISAPSAGDQGYYICSASNSVGTGHSGQTYLNVSGGIPTVRISDSTFTVVTGSDITIPCTVSSTPAASSVSWQRIVNSVTTTLSIAGTKFAGGSVATPSLTIKNADSNDQGFYVCSASNIVGNGQSGQSYLTVTGNVPSVTISSTSYSVVVGNSVTLECVIISSPGHTSVAWERVINGVTTRLSIDGTNYQGGTVSSPSLIITSASVSDQGNYICSAINSVGIGKSGQSYLTVAGNVPSVSIGNPSYSVVIGNTVTIVCSITTATPAATSMSWQKIDGSVTTDLSIIGNKFSGGTLQTPSLTINNAELSDQAYYRCRANNVIGTGESSRTYLYVTGNIPTLTVQQPSYTVSVGNPVTLDCSVSSVPSAQSVSWEFTNTNGATSVVNTNGVDYSGATLNSPSLVIASASTSDQGIYYCKARNQVGTGTSSQIYLYVSGGAPVVVLSKSSFGFLLGTQAELDCEASGSPNVTSVFWQKVASNGIGITLQGSRYSSTTAESRTLTISNVKESDAGNYRCHAVNSIGEGKSALGSLVIYYQPRTTRVTQTSPVVVKENEAFTLTCVSDASPGATYVWKRGSVQVASSANYVVSLADRAHAGTYTCTASNNYGSGSATVVVDVEFRPVSNVAEADLSVTSSLGSPNTLSCLTLSNPDITKYEWEKDGTALSSLTTRDITVTINNNDDYGTYSCYATNSVGRSSAISYELKQPTGTGVTPAAGLSVSDTGLTSGEIAAIILSILFLLLLILLILYCCISHGICVCCKKEKKKRTVAPITPEPEKPKEIIRTIEIPRYVEKPYYYKREPSSSAVSRQDVFINEENFEISRYQMVPPAGTTLDGGTIISVQDEYYRTPRPHHLPALEFNQVNEDEERRKRRRKKKKRRHHRERSEKYHSPRKGDGEEEILASTNRYEDQDLEVHAGMTYYN